MIRLGFRSGASIVLASAAGLIMFCWPLLDRVSPNQQGQNLPWIYLVLMPVIVLIVLAQITDGAMDTKALAMLGVLAAIDAALRPLSAGTAGFETVFFLLILGGRVFGPGFGFALGATSMLTSALLTAGAGPWLPFQTMCAAWIGLGAGLLPRGIRGKSELAMLVAYGIVTAYLYGLLMNLWSWPFLTGITVPDYHGGLSYVAGASVLDNLRRFLLYTLFTSTGGWDTGRAIANTVALLVLGPAVLIVLRRAARKASFD